MSDFTRSDSKYDGLVTLFIMVTDSLFCGLLLLLCALWLDDFSDASTVHNLRQTVLISFVLYFAVTIRSGVVLHKRGARRYQIYSRIFRNVVYYGVASVVVFHVGHFYIFEWYWYICYLIALFLLITLYHEMMQWFVHKANSRPKRQRHFVLVGTTENNLELMKEMTSYEGGGYVVDGYFDDEENKELTDVSYLGTPDDVVSYLQEHREVVHLYCCLPSVKKQQILAIIEGCEKNFVRFFSVPNVRNYVHHSMRLYIAGSVPYMGVFYEPLEDQKNRMIKRMFDLVVSGLFIVLCYWWIYLIVALITKLTMPGPVLFKQKRNGLNGEEFTCLKFRSMKVNAEADSLQATKNDSRVTAWGCFMRKTSIDELPQFVNVFRGDMSIVGPRPHMVKHTEEYSALVKHYMLRHFVKPGITGWSQVTGYRGETETLEQMEGRVRNDIWYCEHWTLWLDIYICFKTFWNVIAGDKQAY